MSSESMGIRVTAVDSGCAFGRTLLQARTGRVIVRGSYFVYGNGIRLFLRTPQTLIGLLSEQLPRWWRVDSGPAQETIAYFSSPGYVCPFEGNVVSGASVPGLSAKNAIDLDIAASHPFNIWESRWNASANSYTRRLQAIQPSTLTTRATQPSLVTAGSGSPQPPVAVLSKNPGLPYNTTFPFQVGPGGLFTPATDGGPPGFYIEGWYSGPERQAGATILNELKREAVYLGIEGTPAGETVASNQALTILIGDLSQYAPYMAPYSYKIVIGRDVVRLFDWNGPGAPIIGLYAPKDERGENNALTIFSALSMNIWNVGIPQTDVELAGLTETVPGPGMGQSGLQGTASQNIR